MFAIRDKLILADMWIEHLKRMSDERF